MTSCNGQIIFACGKRYYEVSQKVIDKLSVGTKMSVFSNNSDDFNHPKDPNGAKRIDCSWCPCRRKAKRNKDITFHKNDCDSNGKPQRTPTGIEIQCAIAELIDDIGVETNA